MKRILFNLPVVLASFFFLYSSLLLWHGFRSQEQLRSAAETRLINEASRRSSYLMDEVRSRLEQVVQLSRGREIETYLTNQDLGMSPRYGLNANLEAIRDRFLQLKSHLGSDNLPNYLRLLLSNSDGVIQVDSQEEDPSASTWPVTPNGVQPTIRIDPQQQRWSILTPILFKNQLRGYLIAAIPFEVLSQHLRPTSEMDGHQELLLHGKRATMPAILWAYQKSCWPPCGSRHPTNCCPMTGLSSGTMKPFYPSNFCCLARIYRGLPGSRRGRYSAI